MIIGHNLRKEIMGLVELIMCVKKRTGLIFFVGYWWISRVHVFCCRIRAQGLVSVSDLSAEFVCFHRPP